MLTLSGRLLTLDNDEAPSVHDIAIGLSRTNRFGGQTLAPWNDAQHSLVCQRIAQTLTIPSWRMELVMLLHDAHEMITGDACRPFKPAGMSALQDELDARIYRSLGVRRPDRFERALQDYIDDAALVAEAMILTPMATFKQACQDVGKNPLAADVDIVEDVYYKISYPDIEYEAQLNLLLREEGYHIGN